MLLLVAWHPSGDAVLGPPCRGWNGSTGTPPALLETVAGPGGHWATSKTSCFGSCASSAGSQELLRRLIEPGGGRRGPPGPGRTTCCKAGPQPRRPAWRRYATQVGRPRDYEALLGTLVDRVAAESNRRLAEVRTAVELDDDRRRQLAGALSRVAGRSVDVRVTVDPTVLGGFVATIGDTVVDGSTRHRLDLLKDRLDTPEAEFTIGEPS